MRTTVLEGRGLGTLPVLPREGRRVVGLTAARALQETVALVLVSTCPEGT